MQTYSQLARNCNQIINIRTPELARCFRLLLAPGNQREVCNMSSSINIPKCFLDVLFTWYSKCFAYVRWGPWGTTISKTFQLLCGVRQGGGGVLSPCLFALFIDSVIQKLHASGCGSWIGKFYFGCILQAYADDTLLVSHAIHVMQLMLLKGSR